MEVEVRRLREDEALLAAAAPPTSSPCRRIPC